MRTLCAQHLGTVMPTAATVGSVEQSCQMEAQFLLPAFRARAGVAIDPVGGVVTVAVAVVNQRRLELGDPFVMSTLGACDAGQQARPPAVGDLFDRHPVASDG